MSRLSVPTLDEMTAEQRAVYDATVAGRRGRTPANVMAWLHSPELASRAQQLGEFVRYNTTLSPRLSELAILLVARQWTSQYEWAVHSGEAVRAGLPAHIINAIASRATPQFESAEEQALFDFSTALLDTHQVPNGVYANAVGALGERATVELVGILGYYTLVAMTLNGFAIDPPAGSRALAP